MHALDKIYGAFDMTGDNTDGQSNADIRSVLGWIVGINATLFVAGVVAVTSVLWGQSVQLTKIAANQDGTQARLVELATQIAQGSANRYTASDAATDRSALLGALNSVREAWVTSATAIQAENTQQSKYINELLIKVTRLEERNGIGRTP